MRVYFDENFSPHLIAGFRTFQEGRKGEDFEVCSVVEEFDRGAADEDWIPEVAKRHGVIITQDINIHRTHAQWQLCQTHKVGVFFIKPPKKMGWSYWDIIRLTMKWWDEIKRLSREETRPFGWIIETTKSKMSKL
ncbi:MAG: hypothetical protein SFU85_12185 [Candidatus Methylacidiphilales bacterium]|nr:hypothetical protein [Candidatus Methylacidiphilales bacterium]